MSDQQTPTQGSVDWDDAASALPAQRRSADKKGSLFLTLVPGGNPFRFHITEKPVCFRQHWLAFKTIHRGPVISPSFFESEMDKDVAWAKGGYVPVVRYACLVIDRETGGLRIIEAGSGVCNVIMDYQESCRANNLLNVNAYGDNAPDWEVVVKEFVNKNGKKRLEYKCQQRSAGGPVTLTQQETDKIAAFTTKVDWSKWYVKSTPEFIKELYDKLPAELKVWKTGTAAPATGTMADRFSSSSRETR